MELSSQNNNLLLHPIRTITVLAIVIFGVITTEFGLIGGLQLIADSFDVSLSQAGTLLSVYAIVVAAFGPFITLVFAQYNQKLILIVAVIFFLVSTIISAVANSFTLMAFSRVLAALVHALVWSLAFSIATSCFPPNQKAKAVSYITLGFIFATILGIPFASYLSTAFSWRWGFVLCIVSHIISLISIILFLPNIPAKPKMTYGNQLSILKKPLVWLNIISTSILFAGMFTGYGYFAPYFSTVTKMSDSTISIMLMVFGSVGIIGNTIFGRITNYNNIAKVLFIVIVMFLIIYNAINLLSNNVIMMIIIISIWGTFFSGAGITGQLWCTMNAQEAPEFANSLYVSFANLGITLGSFSGAMAIKYIGIASIPSIATIFLYFGLIVFFITVKIMRKSRI